MEKLPLLYSRGNYHKIKSWVLLFPETHISVYVTLTLACTYCSYQRVASLRNEMNLKKEATKPDSAVHFLESGQTVSAGNLEKEKQEAVNRGLIPDVHKVFAELIKWSCSSGVKDSKLSEYGQKHGLFQLDSNWVATTATATDTRRRIKTFTQHKPPFAHNEMQPVSHPGGRCDVQKRLSKKCTSTS